MNSFLEMFSYPFMIKALVAGVLISLSAALVGVPLVLRKNSMLGDGLSHVSFGAFAIASAFGLAPLPIAIPAAVLTSFFILQLDRNSRLHGDSIIAITSVSALAIGTFIVSIMGTNIDINNYLFGSILSIGNGEIWLSTFLSIAILVLYVIAHNKIFAVTFDEKFAKAIGINTKRLNMLFAILCSIVTVLGMRLMGALLISSLLIFPTISARIVAKSFKHVTIISALLAVAGFVIGLIASYALSAPTGATIVITNLAILGIVKLLAILQNNGQNTMSPKHN